MLSKRDLKFYVMGIVSSLVILGSTSVFAASSTVLKQLYVDFNTVKKIIIDGVEKKPEDDMKPFVANGRTYVALAYVADAFGKKISFDSKTGTVTIGSAPSPNEISTIEDPLTGPLSKYWSPGISEGSWSVDGPNGVQGERDFAAFNAFLPFNSTKYSVPSSYTIEADIAPSEQGFGGGFYLNWDNSEGFPQLPFMVKISDRVFTSKDAFVARQESKKQLEADKFYRLKVVVNDTDVDVYLDDEYILSDTIPDDLNKGTDFGLASGDDDNSYFRNFKFTTGKED